MMTPSELREYEFKGAGRNAYKSDDVDNFFGEVAVAYEKIFRENAELIKRIGLLADRLEQYKKDEEQIKQAVIGAQKAADVIVKEAERSVEDSKSEAEAILAAAKGEADIIKADAEKQAVADSDLLLSIARDKAEEIINKAKEEAHSIIIEANDSAKDKVGAATRTLTSESLHYEMLKKEVSEFRASILAQYKAHIEMISKLPELAVEEAKKIEENEAAEEVASIEDTETEENIFDEISFVDPENDIIEYSDDEADEDAFSEEELSYDEEDVVKTTLPYDFFEETSLLEFVEDNVEADEIPEPANFDDVPEENYEAFSEDDLTTDSEIIENNEEETVSEDIMISKGFSVNPDIASEAANDVSDSDRTKMAVFSAFETIEDDDEEEPQSLNEFKKRKGFFRRKK